MPPNWEAYQEAYKRGILPPDKKMLYEEAVTRGLVPGVAPEQKSLLQSVGQGAVDFAKGTVKQLPLIGMLGGGTAGTILGAGPWGTVGGAAAGGGIGTGLKNIIESTAGWEEPKPPINQVYDIAKGTLEGATAEAGGAVVGKGLELGLQGAKTITQGARDLLKEGFPITTGSGIEKVAQKIPPGSWFFRKWQGKLNDMVNNSNQQFVQDLNLPQPGLKVSTQVEKDKIFDTIETLVGGPTSQHKVPDLYDFAADNLKLVKTVSKKEGALLEKLVDQIEKNGAANYDVIRDITKNLSSVWGKGPINQKLYFQIKEALQNDLVRIGEGTGNPQIPELYGTAIGLAKNIHEMKNTQFIEKLFTMRNATTIIDNGQTKVFNPVQFQKNVTENYELLKQMYKDKPEVPEMIIAYADKMVNASGDLSAFAKGQQGASFSEKVLGGLLGGGTIGSKMAGIPGGPPIMAIPWGFETMMAKSLANPKGWMKKFLFREGGGAVPQLGALGVKETMMNIPIVPPMQELMP